MGMRLKYQLNYVLIVSLLYVYTLYKLLQLLIITNYIIERMHYKLRQCEHNLASNASNIISDVICTVM